MKKFSVVLASTALAVVAAQSQAALLEVSLSINGTVSGAAIGGATGSITGSGMGALDSNTGIISFSSVVNSVTPVTNVFIHYVGTIDTIAQTTSYISTACIEGGGILPNCGGRLLGYPEVIGHVSETFSGAASGVGDVLTLVAVSDWGSGISAVTTYTFTVPNPVPVPAAAWLFGSALVGLAGIKRKK
ncbi:VPLPA-CTERM sorting domain-containing protein [Oceanicoccus sp. KOV_DT_Chl]|uniref:VPLPA-CTERM sorting domain-containing protein n=1 Tax=Oceanicoccus sp. KOV_DT_Chl TaxID=1904639 RepID=UPI000C7B20CC|nr:VPLPA-CTERM sorting domain-containing protein [Oceanicoccus sp. KOV_DT_Chl]